MLSYLGSYIWGSEDDEQVGIVVEVEGEEMEVTCPNASHIQVVDNEWLLVAPKDEDEEEDEVERRIDEGLEEMELALIGLSEFFELAESCHGKGVNKRHTAVRFIPLKDLKDRVTSGRKFVSPKNLKRGNMVQVRVKDARNRKQFGRMEGKHSGMVASRFGRY